MVKGGDGPGRLAVCACLRSRAGAGAVGGASSDAKPPLHSLNSDDYPDRPGTSLPDAAAPAGAAAPAYTGNPFDDPVPAPAALAQPPTMDPAVLAAREAAAAGWRARSAAAAEAEAQAEAEERRAVERAAADFAAAEREAARRRQEEEDAATQALIAAMAADDEQAAASANTADLLEFENAIQLGMACPDLKTDKELWFDFWDR